MRTREAHINIRTTPQEKAKFERNARKCGLSLSEYLRKLANGHEPKALPPLEYRKVYALLTKETQAILDGEEGGAKLGNDEDLGD